jgi:ribosomal protein S27AE
MSFEKLKIVDVVDSWSECPKCGRKVFYVFHTKGVTKCCPDTDCDFAVRMRGRYKIADR